MQWLSVFIYAHGLRFRLKSVAAVKKNFATMQKVCIFALSFGKMAERSNAAVLKTVDLHGSGGSNPSLSADETGVARFMLATSFFYIPNFNFSLLTISL